MKSLQKGFTLIELMIVIAILGILMAIAIPAYQDYTIRAKFSECVNGNAPNKLGVSEFVISNGHWPATLASFGQAFSSNFCEPTIFTTAAAGASPTLSISNAVGLDAALAAGAINVELIATTDNNNNVTWVCSATAGDRYAPASCRN